MGVWDDRYGPPGAPAYRGEPRNEPFDLVGGLRNVTTLKGVLPFGSIDPRSVDDFSKWTDVAPLLNSWVSQGDPYPVARWRKAHNGLVILSGLIKDGTVTNGTDLFVLPTEARPDYRAIFICWPGHRIDVYADGTVELTTANGTSAFVSLEGIRFQAAT